MRTYLLALSITLAFIGCGDDNSTVPTEGADTVIDTPPASLTRETHFAVRFHANGPTESFQCSLDGATPSACTSPWMFDATNGAHTIAIVAINFEGIGGALSSATFTVDTVAPDTAITVGPSAVETTGSASFTFSALPAEAGTTFECALDIAAFATCVSPVGVTVGAGAHTFKVRAADALGNVDATPASSAWTVDASGPPVVITQKPNDPSNVLTPSFGFSSTSPGATFECQVDGFTNFTACTSPYVTPSLTEGTRTFRVRATFGVGQMTATYAWVVDITPPTVAITGGPTGPTNTATPTFMFSTSSDAATVECAIDVGTFSPCTSPITTAPLPQGMHTITVRATDVAGNPASASRMFTVNSICNNGVLEAGEQCDGTILSGQTCGSLGHDSGTLTCDPSTCTFVEASCGDCGDGVINGTELCDQVVAAGVTCASEGHAPGTLTCNASCSAYNTSACDGGFLAVNGAAPNVLPSDATICPGSGLVYGQQQWWIGVCTENYGVFRLDLSTAFNQPLFPAGSLPFFVANNPASGTSSVTNLHGRTIQQQTNGAIAFLADASSPNNAFRAGGGGLATLTPNWSRGVMGPAGATTNLYGVQQGTGPTGSMAMGHSSTQGAVVFNGALTAAATASVVGAGVTGTATATANSYVFDSNGFPASTTDIYVAVYGKTPDATGNLTVAAPGGGGIFWTCNRTPTTAGFLERDTGLGTGAGSSPDDKDRVWGLALDLTSMASHSAVEALPCVINGTTFPSILRYGSIYYAALRGGGRVYRTANAGASWEPFNTGLPANIDVWQIVVDTADHTQLYAATSAGLYHSVSGGAWTLEGLEGRVVRTVALSSHAVGTPPIVFVGVEATPGGAVIFQRGIAP